MQQNIINLFVLLIVAMMSHSSSFPIRVSKRIFNNILNWPRRANNVIARASSTQEYHKRVKVLIPIADGSEELETVTVADILARAGADVALGSVSSSLLVKCSRGVELKANMLISDPECRAERWDMIVCPGGMPGAEHLASSKQLREILLEQHSQNRYIAGICAAPAVVFARLNLLNGKSATCYPAPKFTEAIASTGGGRYIADRVVVDGKLITSQGPGTAMEFALKLVDLLYGEAKATQVSRELLNS